MPTMKKNRRLLRLEGLETRNLLSPMHGLEAQSLLSFPSPTLTSDLISTANAEPVERLDASDASKAARESNRDTVHQNAEDTSAVQTIPDSSEADQGNHLGDTLTETENHSHSDGNPDTTQNAGDQNQESANAEVKNTATQAITDSSAADPGNHDGNTLTETENHSHSDGNPHSTPNSGDQKDESISAEVNNTTPQGNSDHSDQSVANLTSTDGSNKDAADHSKDGKNSGNDVDQAKQPAVLIDPHANNGGNQKVSGDSDDSDLRSGLGSDGRSSTGSGDQVSSGNPGQPAGKTGDSEDGGIALVSDGGSHSQANPGHKDISSPSTVSSAGSDLLVGHAVHNALASSAGSSSTSGVLLDAAPLAASVALQSLEAGTDSLLQDLPHVANTAAQVLHTGVEVLATPIGMGEMAVMETLPVGACDLLLGFLPVDQESLDQAMQGFLSRVENLGEQLTGSEAGTWLYPVVLTVLVVAQVASRRRRRSPKQQIWTVDRGSWMGNWFPSLSTLQK